MFRTAANTLAAVATRKAVSCDGRRWMRFRKPAGLGQGASVWSSVEDRPKLSKNCGVLKIFSTRCRRTRKKKCGTSLHHG